MGNTASVPARRSATPPPRCSWPDPLRHGLNFLIIGLLLLAATLLVYRTGGTSYAYPYLLLVPVILAAALYHFYGGLVAAIIAAALVGPHMPLDVAQGVAQPPSNWMLRLAIYIALGSFTGVLFGRLASAAREREAAMRTTGTGMLSHSALLADLSDRLERASHNGRDVALIMVQIADFAEILSSIGADAEHDLVRAIARNLGRAVDGEPHIYHFGSSELVILLEYVEREELEQAAERIAAAGEDPVSLHGVPVRAQLVAGISQVDDCKPQELIRKVRVAAFEALEQQQAYCHYTPDLERDTAETMHLVTQVRRALATHEFELHYQPKIRLSDGTVAGCEGLLRWRDKKRGLIAPGLFMPKVERTTLIAPVTRFVSMTALDFLQDRELAPVSINFTVGNLFDEKLLRWFLRLVHERELPPNLLEIEITEGALIRDAEAAKRVVQQLRQAGVNVLLDDFGTGYSSLQHLRHLPITGLKIDRAFVRDLESDWRLQSLITCMIDMAHSLGLSVTAEGVETKGQAELLRKLGCDLAQGFYYATPMPAAAYHEWLHKRQAGSSRAGG